MGVYLHKMDNVVGKDIKKTFILLAQSYGLLKQN